MKYYVSVFAVSAAVAFAGGIPVWRAGLFGVLIVGGVWLATLRPKFPSRDGVDQW